MRTTADSSGHHFTLAALHGTLQEAEQFIAAGEETDDLRQQIAAMLRIELRPPIVPTEAKYSQQRRYGMPTEAYGMHLNHDIKEPPRNVLTVFRDGHHDVAELTIEMGVRTLASITVRMTPAELRRAAASMLDAAHDIEVFPAELLQRDAQQGGAA